MIDRSMVRIDEEQLWIHKEQGFYRSYISTLNVKEKKRKKKEENRKKVYINNKGGDVKSKQASIAYSLCYNLTHQFRFVHYSLKSPKPHQRGWYYRYQEAYHILCHRVQILYYRKGGIISIKLFSRGFVFLIVKREVFFLVMFVVWCKIYHRNTTKQI